MRKVDKIIIHCSDSEFGCSKVVDKWHKERGWSEIGYHYVITNGIINSRDLYTVESDGLIEQGRREDVIGAHCRGKNTGSIGVCLVGREKFTARQFGSLGRLLNSLIEKYNITIDNIFGHRDFNPHKRCPNIDTEKIRKIVLKNGGTMEHGITPVEYKIVVKPDAVEEVLGEGLLVKAETTKDTDERMQTRGTLVEVSEMAFTNDDGNRWRCRLPKIGDRVEYARYAGQPIMGDDEEKYVVMNDKDLVAILGA